MTSSSLILIGGGARSGKSSYALERAELYGPDRVFVATAEARDGEMQERIQAHQRERRELFRTVEEPLAVPEVIAANGDADVILVDCLTLWICNLMWDAQGELRPANWIHEQIERLTDAIQNRTCPVIIVSNEVGLGIVPEHPSARHFRDCAGRAHQRIAGIADEVCFAVFGCVLRVYPTLETIRPLPQGNH